MILSRYLSRKPSGFLIVFHVSGPIKNNPEPGPRQTYRENRSQYDTDNGYRVLASVYRPWQVVEGGDQYLSVYSCNFITKSNTLHSTVRGLYVFPEKSLLIFSVRHDTFRHYYSNDQKVCKQ